MEDVTLIQLFARMDDHLARQDAMMLDMSRLLQATAEQVAEIHTTASRGFAGAMHVLSNLMNRLERSPEDRRP